jgi:chaperone modulatory protein CbpM
MRTSEFLLAARLDAPVLAAWVEAGWLLPRQEEDTADFSDVDLARARLIHDLQQDMGVNEEAIPIVLDLLDQVHGLRQMLRDLAAAVLRSRKKPGSGSLPRSAPPHPCGAVGLCHAGGSLLDVSRRCSRGYEENQLRRISVPARGHTSGDLALSPVHTELS